MGRTQVLGELAPPAPACAKAMRAPLSLKRNAVWTTIGNGAYAAAQWSLIALIARIGSSAEVGQYALSVAISAPIFMFFNLQLRPVQATDSTRRYSFPEYLGLRLLCSACAFALVAAFAFGEIRSPRAAALLLLIGLYKAIESISDIYQGLLQQCERMDYVGRSFVLKSVLIAGSFGLAYYATRNVLIGAAAMLCAQLNAVLFYDVRASYLALHGELSDWASVLRDMTRASADFARLKQLARRALPLGIAMMLISLYANLPRFFLDKYDGASGLGIFAAITYMSMVGSLLMTAIGTALSPRLAQYAVTNRRAYRDLLSKFVFAAAAMGALGIVGSVIFGAALLKRLYGAEYAAHSGLLVWIMISGALSYVSSAFGFGATAMGRFKAQPAVVLVSTLILLCASFLLVPTRGLEGAAIAIVVSTTTSLCGFIGIVLCPAEDISGFLDLLLQARTRLSRRPVAGGLECTDWKR